MTASKLYELRGPPLPLDLDSYKDWLLAWLGEYPHLSAGVHDWFLERYPNLTIGGSTVRFHVKEIRENYH